MPELQNTLSDSELAVVQDLKRGILPGSVSSGPIAHVYYNSTSDTVLSSYNVTSVTKISPGVFDIQISVADPPDERRMPVASNATGAARMFTEDSFGSGQYRVRCWDDAGAAAETVVRWALWDIAGAAAP